MTYYLNACLCGLWSAVSFSHVFETVDDDTVPESSSSKTESQIKTLEALLETRCTLSSHAHVFELSVTL